MKSNWLKITIILIVMAITVGNVTPLSGNAFTEILSFSSKTVVQIAPEGKTSVTYDHSNAIPTEKGKPSHVRKFGSFLLLGSGMLILANWGKRKVRS